MKSYYITTPIYYVNDKPHIGHAYTTIICDSFARFNRFLGREVCFLTGTDEHGEKIEKTAKELNKDIMVHVDDMALRFKDMWKHLGIQYDDFIRTTEVRHKAVVQNVIAQLLETGDIYLGKYDGWYCIPCESFFTESQLNDGKCPDCHRSVKAIEEKNYFFKLAKYQQWLVEYIEMNKQFILPAGKREEVRSFLKNPLEDLCISRPKERLAWGIPFPGNDEFVIYVWFDALVNYISAIGYGTDPERFNACWPADVHLIGKDILRHHAVYWPIMLKALDIAPPKHILAHGWWTIEGGKVSKSLGNVVDPLVVSEKYGIDTFRYYLLREAPLGSDGAYSEALLVSRFNSDLANDLGNLVHRAFSMLEKYYSGVVPEIDPADADTAFKELATALKPALEQTINVDFQPREALLKVWELISVTNKLVEDAKPWQLAKDATKKHQLDVFMYTLFELLRFIAVGLISFLPDTSARMLELLKIEKVSGTDLDTWGLLRAGSKLEKGSPLFPRIEG